MCILVISDLHLSEDRPDITEAFFSFIKNKAQDCKTLYILGDFFDIWIGDDNIGSFERFIAQALKQLADKGVRIYLMHGNRDFAIGRVFCRLAGCVLIKDPTLTCFYETPVLLSHGDILCTQDIEYQRKRRFYRNPIVLFILKISPLKLRQRLGKKLHTDSGVKKKNKTAEIMDVSHQSVIELLEKHNVQLLIHGHTHRPTVHELVANQQSAKRIVLGDWEPNGIILRVTAKGFELESAN